MHVIWHNNIYIYIYIYIYTGLRRHPRGLEGPAVLPPRPGRAQQRRGLSLLLLLLLLLLLSLLLLLLVAILTIIIITITIIGSPIITIDWPSSAAPWT